MADEGGDALAGGDVPQLDGLVGRPGGEGGAVGAEGERVDRLLLAVCIVADQFGHAGGVAPCLVRRGGLGGILGLGRRGLSLVLRRIGLLSFLS